jgi:DNA-binding NarL/FixJ family response regulator
MKTVDSPIRILVVDDYPLLREGVAAVLEQEPDMELVAEASNGLEAMEQFRRHRPDVTLMDIEMPGMCGIEVIAAIRKEFEHAVIMVLATYKGDVQALRALKAGAQGLMLKSAAGKELVDSIRALDAGKRCISPEIATEIASHAIDDALTLRETSVLKCVAAGQSNKVVARELSISEDTVKVHMKNILSKLDARARTHAVAIALQRGIIGP